MKTGINKTNSSLQKDINRMKNRCTDLQKSLMARKNYMRSTHDFVEYLFDQGRITKEELRIFFKKKNTLLILLLLTLNILSGFSQSSKIDIVSRTNLLYGRNHNTFDYDIRKDGNLIWDYEFAILINDKKMGKIIMWDINRPQRTRKIGKVLFWTGLSAIVVPGVKMIFKGQSDTYWENIAIFGGICTTTIGAGMTNYKDEYNSIPEHYYDIIRARSWAETYNSKLK
jgi:hypothetical protein